MRNFLKTLSISSIFLCLSLFSGCSKNIPYENTEEKLSQIILMFYGQRGKSRPAAEYDNPADNDG